MTGRPESGFDTTAPISLPAARIAVAGILGTIFVVTGAWVLLSIPESPLGWLLGAAFCLGGGSGLIWTVWGHNVVAFDARYMRVEARLWGRTLASRDFDLPRISAVRVDTSLYAPWNTLHSPSGLPARLDIWNPPVRFNYDGRRYAFGDGLDGDAQSQLVTAIQSAISAVDHENAPGDGRPNKGIQQNAAK